MGMRAVLRAMCEELAGEHAGLLYRLVELLIVFHLAVFVYFIYRYVQQLHCTSEPDRSAGCKHLRGAQVK